MDDEPLALSLIESYVVKTPFLSLKAKCSCAADALAAIANGGIDLVFLDIQMPEMNGMELSKMLKDTLIVFTTAFEQYAVEGYKVNAVGYLLKPFSYSEFLSTANRVFEIFHSTDIACDNKKLVIKADSRQIILPVDTISFIKSERDYVKIFSDELENGYVMTLMSMKSLEDTLPSDKFIRVHRSYIVNVDKVRTMERGRIIFGDEYIPVSDSCREAFEKMLFKK